MQFLVPSGSPRLAVAADRLAEACLLRALRDRARADADALALAAAEAARKLALQRELVHSDLVACFGVSTLSLLHAVIVDAPDPRLGGARAIVTYRYRYELRPSRADRQWQLTLLDADGRAALDAHRVPIVGTFTMDTHGDAAVTELWCQIAALAQRGPL